MQWFCRIVHLCRNCNTAHASLQNHFCGGGPNLRNPQQFPQVLPADFNRRGFEQTLSLHQDTELEFLKQLVGVHLSIEQTFEEIFEDLTLLLEDLMTISLNLKIRLLLHVTLRDNNSGEIKNVPVFSHYHTLLSSVGSISASVPANGGEHAPGKNVPPKKRSGEIKMTDF